MNLTPSALPLQSSNLRKREFQEYVEAGLNEQDRRGKFNAAYREDDRKFMRFLIPPGKRVLELGCGRGELLAALEPSYGVGVDFGARTDCQGQGAASRSAFCSGRRGRSGDAGRDRGAVRLHRDRRHHRHVRGHRRHVETGASSVRAVDADHHLLLFPSVGADPEARRVAATAEQATEDQLHRHGRFPEPDGSRGFRGDQSGATAIDSAALVRSRSVRQSIHRAAAGIRQLCLRTYIVGRPVRPVSRPEIFRQHPDSLPQREGQHRKRDPAHAPVRQLLRKSCSSKAIPATAHSRNASGFAMPTRIAGTSRC